MTRLICGFLVFFIMVLTGVLPLHAQGDDSLISEEGSGPTLSEGTGTSVPEVGSSGPAGVVVEQDDTGGSDPSAFEGDSESTPGERAPEELPMDDTPVDAGAGI